MIYFIHLFPDEVFRTFSIFTTLVSCSFFLIKKSQVPQTESEKAKIQIKNPTLVRDPAVSNP